MRAQLIAALLFSLPSCASVYRATADDDRGTLKRLLAKGDDPNDTSGKDGSTALFEAIEQHNMPVVRMLVEAGADVNRISACRGGKATPLQKALIHGDVHIVRYLLSKGADASIDIHETMVALVRSPTRRDTGETARAILPAAEKKMGQKALASALDTASSTGWTALTAAAYGGDDDVVRALLDHGASPSVTAAASNVEREMSDLWPPLHFARFANHDSTASLLVRGGADPKQKSEFGRDADAALERVEALRERRAERERQQAREDEQARAAQWQAIQSGLTSGYQKASSSENPANDDAFQARVKAIADEDRARKEAARTDVSGRTPTGSGGSTPSGTSKGALGTSSSATSASSGSRPEPGSIVLQLTPAPTPTASAAPAPTASSAPPPPQPKWEPPPKPVCHTEPIPDRPASSGMRRTREEAEQSMKNLAAPYCVGARPTSEKVYSGLSCEEHRSPNYEPTKEGKWKRLEDTVQWRCEATVHCVNPREVCGSGGGTSSGKGVQQ